MTARLVRLSAEDDFDSWRDAARTLAIQGVPASDIVWQVGDDATDLFAVDAAIPVVDTPPGFRVPRDFIALARQVILHSQPDRFALLYALLLRVIDNPQVIDDRTDRQVRQLGHLRDTIRRDLHKMRAFVRFRRLETEQGLRYVAWFEPEHHILRANAGFFVDRFTTMDWSILTPRRSIHWDGRTLQQGPGAVRSDVPDEDRVEDVWKAYYSAIFNPARLNRSAMLKEMPKKYWKNMPETALVPELIAGARARELDMIEQARANPPPAPARSGPARTVPQALSLLREEASACRRCPLWKPATQTVFGEGRQDASLMIVGEQPGDQEDLAGRPFVGPAGQLLDRALAEAGIDRADAYVTNAVKHFKHELRGKRRLHATPTASEVDACRWWVDQEKAIVRPRIILALGASAARSVLGRTVKIGETRGRPIPLDDHTTAWVTAHPSSILRTPDPEAAQQAYVRLVDDLRGAAAALEEADESRS